MRTAVAFVANVLASVTALQTLSRKDTNTLAGSDIRRE